ncbi:MAG: hypothetical protein AAGG48_25400 [Planctomycetota bacterium]
MVRFRLSTLLLLVTIVALCTGWLVDRSREPKVFYLHVYGWHYAQNYDAIEFVPTLAPDRPREEWYTRLATIAISPDVPFHAEVPNNYYPSIVLQGCLLDSGRTITGSLRISLEDPGTAFDYDHTIPIPLDTLVPFWNDYKLAVTTTSDPYFAHYPDEMEAASPSER